MDDRFRCLFRLHSPATGRPDRPLRPSANRNGRARDEAPGLKCPPKLPASVFASAFAMTCGCDLNEWSAPVRSLLTVAICFFLPGCLSSGPPPSRSVQAAAAAPTLSSGTKRIIRDAGEFILPDGTRVEADERGGFRLPNGEHVAALADGLLLPNGVQCPADGAGAYICP
jgi:hypothetical protein